MDFEVRQIETKEAHDLILNVHYAGRLPSVSYTYGLFGMSGALLGIVCYGTPPSPPLRRGICGDDYKGKVLELNRLCLYHNEPNYASMLVGRSLRLLPKDKVVVSFADISQGHVGYVYQATNFIYCGLSAKRTDWKIKGKEHLHGISVADEFRGKPKRSELLREKYGDDFYLAPRPRKHRYVFFTGSKKQRKGMLLNLKYKVLPYPKGQQAA